MISGVKSVSISIVANDVAILSKVESIDQGKYLTTVKITKEIILNQINHTVIFVVLH